MVVLQVGKKKNSERNRIDLFELSDAQKDAETLTEAQRGEIGRSAGLKLIICFLMTLQISVKV